MSEMEPEVKNFLAKIATSASVAILWLLFNSTVGIGFDMAFFNGTPKLINWIFYLWFVLSFLFLVRYLFRKWR
ncbi:hypothetical protein BH09BAC2_BH09BAC2_04880 [soil metagenome]